jgi:excisionase family DNA binding protein
VSTSEFSDELFEHFDLADRGTLSLDEAAKRLGLSVRAVRRAIATGEIQAIRIGRRWLVLRSPLEQMLAGGSPPKQPDPEGKVRRDRR